MSSLPGSIITIETSAIERAKRLNQEHNMPPEVEAIVLYEVDGEVIDYSPIAVGEDGKEEEVVLPVESSPFVQGLIRRAIYCCVNELVMTCPMRGTVSKLVYR